MKKKYVRFSAGQEFKSGLAEWLWFRVCCVVPMRLQWSEGLIGVGGCPQRWWTHMAVGRRPQFLTQGDFLATWQLPLCRVSCPREGTRKNTASFTTRSHIITSHLICLLEASHWVQHTFQGRGIWPHLLMGGGFPCGSAGNRSACNAGDLGSIPGLGRFPGERKGYPLQYSGLENSMDCIVHGVGKSQTWLNDFHFTHTWPYMPCLLLK